MFAAVCVLLAATGHVAMSGQDLPAAALAAASAGTLAVAWILAARERGLLAVTAATVAVQSVLHTAFSWSQRHEALASGQPGTARTVTDRMSMSHAAMGHAAMGHAAMGHAATDQAAMGHAATAHATMSHAAMGHMTMAHEALGHVPASTPSAAHDVTNMSSLSSSLGMLSAHLLAALLSGLWMAYGERAVFRLVRALPLWRFRPPWHLWLLLAAVVPAAPRRPRVRPARAADDERAPRGLLLARSVVSRGPPREPAVI
ncbi:hypothetical protein [Streptomyces sp. NPDC056361]|uniref:hypothetical protein n=1 Tax=Streptomyces sp. NPDC056361 TaxID=3345795 RepID=UPI0035E2428C